MNIITKINKEQLNYKVLRPLTHHSIKKKVHGSIKFSDLAFNIIPKKNKIPCPLPRHDHSIFYNNKCYTKKYIYTYIISNNKIYLSLMKNGVLFAKTYSYSKYIYNYYINNITANIFIHNKTNIINNVRKYEAYIINLEHRTDRKNGILSNHKYKQLSLKFFNAIKSNSGMLGCGASHIALINYAKFNNMPYIIVIEDDNKINVDNLSEILDNLFITCPNFEVFNGSPHLFGMPEPKLISNKIDNSSFYSINKGQSTNFIIYNHTSYDKMLKYKLSGHIDIFISHNLKQITALENGKFICEQGESYSDITDQTTDYTFIYRDSEKMLINLNLFYNVN